MGIVTRWRPGRFALNSANIAIWLGLRALALLGTTFILTRHLGAAHYGAFVALAAVGSFLIPLVGMGLQGPLLREVSRTPSHQAALLRHALRVWMITLPMALLLALVLTRWLLPEPMHSRLSAFAWVIGSDLVLLSLTELAGRAEQGAGRMRHYGALTGIAAGLRLAAACLLLLLAPAGDFTSWLWLYGGSGWLGVTVVLLFLRRTLRNGAVATNSTLQLREGIPFVIGSTSLRLQSEFNKPVLANINLTSSGVFNVAQRSLDILGLPLLAMQEALWPRVYRADHLREVVPLLVALALAALGLGALAWLSAPLVPMVFGESFAATVPTLRWLALLPLLQLSRNVLNVWLTHQHRTRFIAIAYVVGGIAAILVTTLFVREWGLPGAVGAAYLVELVVIATLATGLLNREPAQPRQ
ncbi:hypothetical protein MASR1M8_23830 [Thermomonas brevis]